MIPKIRRRGGPPIRTYFHKGLRNDSISETFQLKHNAGTHPFPIRYVKILPLQTWGSTFNFSIWYVSLGGCKDQNIIHRCLHSYSLHMEREALRVCMKHLRRKCYTKALAVLSKETNTSLEHPLLTQLHKACTAEDNTQACEQIFARAVKGGLMSEYLRSVPLVPVWKQLLPPQGAPNNCTPGMRGGHQLVCDSSAQTIYLLGGWDGQQDLSDFWMYSIANNEWTCISPDTRLQGGPTPRSCHKICLDEKRKQMFVLGRYVDSKSRAADSLKSDFYMYDLDLGRWTLISEDTGAEGGPRLVLDHQMIMDSQNRTIYVFGGRVLTRSRWENLLLNHSEVTVPPPRHPELELSGLYRYHVATNTWMLVRDDEPQPGVLEKRFSPPRRHSLKSRVGHSMLFNPLTRQLFVLAGQRHRDYLTDFFTYNVDSDLVFPITNPSTHIAPSLRGADAARGESQSSPRSRNFALSRESSTLFTSDSAFPYKLGNLPAAGITQRATIDPVLEEIHVLSGFSKDKEKRDLVCNSFWVYSIPQKRWTCIYYHTELGGDTSDRDPEPCPRYAHQLVYDHLNKVHYMFGGNPGQQNQAELRLDDFWSLELQRPSEEKLLSDAIFAIRKSRFEELAVEDTTRALDYLQTELNAAVDHKNTAQVAELQQLASKLFEPADPKECQPPPIMTLPRRQHRKLAGFEDILGESSDDFIGENEPEAAPADNESIVQKQFKAWKYKNRMQLFDYLSKFFPEEMTQPKLDLENFISL